MSDGKKRIHSETVFRYPEHIEDLTRHAEFLRTLAEHVVSRTHEFSEALEKLYVTGLNEESIEEVAEALRAKREALQKLQEHLPVQNEYVDDVVVDFLQLLRAADTETLQAEEPVEYGSNQFDSPNSD